MAPARSAVRVLDPVYCLHNPKKQLVWAKCGVHARPVSVMCVPLVLINPKKQVVKHKALCKVILKAPRSPPRDPKGPQRPARGSLRDPKPPLKEPKRSPKDPLRLSKDP